MTDLDGAYSLLANSQRRSLLQVLREHEEASIETLAEEIAAKEDLPQEQVHVALVHKHLPKLADHDIVAYDHETVVLLETPSELDPLLEIDVAGTQATH